MGIGEQIVGLKGPRRFDSEQVEVKPEPAAMHVIGAQVDDDHDDIRSIRGLLAIRQQPLVVDWMKPQAPVVL